MVSKYISKRANISIHTKQFSYSNYCTRENGSNTMNIDEGRVVCASGTVTGGTSVVAAVVAHGGGNT